MKLIVGLGNVGPKYARTRHNVGFVVVDELASKFGGTWKLEPKLKAEMAAIKLDGEEVILAKPQTMMNLSGEAVQKILSKNKGAGLSPNRMWVVHDDIDLEDGILRMKIGGSAGGQLGVSSIINKIGSEFHRVRIGIGRNDRDAEPAEEYVMKPVTEHLREQILGNALAFDRIIDYIISGQQE
jgi:PTH1 family peptidyl-tRNA hydrolase